MSPLEPDAPTERMRLGERILRATVRLSCRAPRWTVTVAIVLAISSCTLAVLRLEMKSSRLDLLDPDREYNRRWLAYLDEYGSDDDVVFVCKGPPDQIARIAESVALQLEEEPQVGAPLWRITPTDWLGSQALSADRMSDLLQWLDHFDVGNVESWARYSASTQLSQLAFADGGSAARTNIFVSNLADSLETPESTVSPIDLGIGRADSRLLVNDAGDQTLVLAPVRRDGNGGFLGGAELFARLRKIAKETSRRFNTELNGQLKLNGKPELDGNGVSIVEIGITGMPVLEFEEMAASQRDSIRASIISLLSVAILFVVSFGQLRLPLIAVSCLIMSVAWTMGYITLTIGHLNLLSVAFGAILVGLGIDFTIHFAAAFQAERSSGVATMDALQTAVGQRGIGILTGGLTSALAFVTAAWTPFRGLAELGWVTSGGLLLCLAGTLIVFPAMICLTFGTSPRRSARAVSQVLPLGRMVAAATNNSRAVLFLSLGLTAIAAFQARRVSYDHNLLNLQPSGVDSVRWERELIDKSSRSVWFAVSMADTSNEVKDRKNQFLALPEVATVEELASPFEVSAAQAEQVKQLRAALTALPRDPVRLSTPPHENWRRLVSTVDLAVEQFPVGTSAKSLRDLQQSLQQLGPENGASQLASVEAAWRRRLWFELFKIRQLASRPFTTSQDLPPDLRGRFIGKSGSQLLRIYPKGDIWDLERLERFVAAVESVDPQITGHPVQTYYASREMQESYIHAAIYAGIAVVMVLYIDFQSLSFCLLAMSPMFLGIIQTIGLLAAFDIPLNAANMIVLPLILGIGIDDGVHVVHDYQRRRTTGGDYAMSDTTATAITITSATTMAGFGSLMLAEHRGLRSLGQVLTLGIFCCWFCSLVVLPALLRWKNGKGH